MIERDVRGLACPGPVIELRRLLDADTPAVRMIVGDELARSNVTRFAVSRGAEVSVEPVKGGGFTLLIRCSSAGVPSEDSLGERAAAEPPALDCGQPGTAVAASGPLVVQVSAASMGAGDDELGELLLRSFIKTLLQLERLPDTILFYNSGVRLCCNGSTLRADLEEISARGTELLACGTCLSFYGLASELVVGRVTDMLEIVTRLSGARNVIRP